MIPQTTSTSRRGRGLAGESGASVIWVSRTGAVSNSDPTYIPISDYMAIDCYSAMNDGSGEPRHRFVILLER